MNFHQYHSVDVVNGPGTRCTLFVAGCEHRCPGCYNATTWSLNSGQPFTDEMEERIIADLNDSRIKRRGLSLSGGDPLHPANVNDLYQLISRVRESCIGKDIWLWTGYELDKVSHDQWKLLDMVDVVIDGPFIRSQADPTLRWRGSKNQRVIEYRNNSQKAATSLIEL